MSSAITVHLVDGTYELFRAGARVRDRAGDWAVIARQKPLTTAWNRLLQRGSALGSRQLSCR